MKQAKTCHLWTSAPKAYTSERLQQEAKNLGWKMITSHPNLNPPSPNPGEMLWPRSSGLNYCDLDLELAQQWALEKEIKVLNPAQEVSKWRDKYKQFLQQRELGLPHLTTWRLDDDQLEQHLNGADESSEFIIKPLRSSQGKGLFLAKGVRSTLSIQKAFYDLNDQRFVVQPHLKKKAEWRLFCYGADQKVMWIERRPKQADSLIGNRWACDERLLKDKEKSQNMKAIEDQLKKNLSGLYYWGADILQGHDDQLIILEVNTSPGLQGPEQLSSKNIARKLLEGAENY